ncbi:hypothetical protein PHAMO_10290 [Magnetospirillum molischianum DSM 120]|uniref:Uncharacterized protein n=1 Tax=Magnetospirillum molischianum DSM 120 TaxID=1150626 RepID=H8FNC7_MAGML|nr:hypothetical protein PHAMO_10290 [Magnetospirillum molischianum DSM 120]
MYDAPGAYCSGRFRLWVRGGRVCAVDPKAIASSMPQAILPRARRVSNIQSLTFEGIGDGQGGKRTRAGNETCGEGNAPRCVVRDEAVTSSGAADRALRSCLRPFF